MIASAENATQIPDAAESSDGVSAFRTLYRAALGAGIVVREEGGRLFDYLVERGTPLEEPLRRQAVAARQKIGKDAARGGRAINRAVGRVVRRYAGPAEEEITDLNTAADDLESRVDKLG